MQSDIRVIPQPGAPSSDVSAGGNRVLRNTYLLLALSMIPTVIGATLGVQLGFGMLIAGSPGMSVLLFLGIAFGFMFGIEKTKDSAMGVVLLLAFTFFMGLMLSNLLGVILKFRNGGNLIALAFGGTSVIFFGMATLAASIKRDLSNMGKFLFAGAVLLMIAAVANVFLQIPALMLTISVIAIAIFSAFLLYDVNRIIKGGETNYISATLAIYLDLYNVFSNLLVLLGVIGGDRD